jgi:hypothetical protein
MDGVFGAELFHAIQSFQRNNALGGRNGRGDGIVGENTLAALDRRLNAEAHALRPTAITTAAGTVPQPHTPASTTPAPGMSIPRGDLLLEAYQNFEVAGNPDASGMPCTRLEDGEFRVSNQCAVRLSIALAHANCGFDFSQWTHGLVHDNRGLCRDQPAHVTGSIELADYLVTLGLVFTTHEKTRLDRAEGDRLMALYTQRPGIIFFREISPRRPGRPGNHIDYWDGSQTMNERLNYHAAGEPPSSRSYFRRARQVRFTPTA